MFPLGVMAAMVSTHDENSAEHTEFVVDIVAFADETRSQSSDTNLQAS